MQKSGTAVTVLLLVTLGHLLERYDEGLQSERLEPSELRLRLRKSNYHHHRKLATERQRGTTSHVTLLSASVDQVLRTRAPLNKSRNISFTKYRRDKPRQEFRPFSKNGHFYLPQSL